VTSGLMVSPIILRWGGDDFVEEIDGLVRALDHGGVVLAAQAHGDDAFVVFVPGKAVSPESVEYVGVCGVVP